MIEVRPLPAPMFARLGHYQRTQLLRRRTAAVRALQALQATIPQVQPSAPLTGLEAHHAGRLLAPIAGRLPVPADPLAEQHRAVLLDALGWAPTCRLAGCYRPRQARGVCMRHYHQLFEGSAAA